MKIKGPVFFSVIVVVLLVAAYFPSVTTDPDQKEAVLMRTIIKGLENMHFQPVSVDDGFSEKVYDLYIDQIDGGRRFLTQEDLALLGKYRSLIDDEARSGTYAFFNLSLERVEGGMDKTQGFYRELLAKPFDFGAKEEFELDGDKRQFAKDDKALKEAWRKYLKYEVLTRYAKKLNAQKEAGEDSEQKSPAALEEESRKDVLDMFDKWFERLRDIKRDDRLSNYINTMTSIYDPHTNYFKPIDKANFDIRFSGRLEGIGARLTPEGDYTKVHEVVVGGPAWKGKKLQDGDIILKVAQGNEEPVDIKGMQQDDVVQLVRGRKDTEVRLTVRKIDGSEAVISIIRDIVIIDERFAKSLILDGVNEGERIGYLYLPSFYADFENEDGRNCADDVKRELDKLKAQKVSGIILDLRSNGGGSLRDVVKMSGYFIEQGPIVQVKSKNRAPEVLSDVDFGVEYDGPVVVMVNHFSASASEILAAALQDYKRAVIVGSTSTFGKGTVQRFVDLDRTVRGFEDIKPLGQVKLTMQKFYRINGGSTQLRGVVPDVILPDNLHYIVTGEKEEKYPLEWTEIPAVPYSQNVMTLTDKTMERIRKNSELRLSQSDAFTKILENAARLKKQREETLVSLNMDEYQARGKKEEQVDEEQEATFDKTVLSGIQNLPDDLPAFAEDPSKKARNEEWLKSVAKDIYILETLHIMHDLMAKK